MCTPHVCLVSEESEEGIGSLRTGVPDATIWMKGTEPQPSARAGSALNHRVIIPALFVYIFILFNNLLSPV